uniref:Uncharacterized protein n=1 Tax=Solanum lycopersicum TaxID=4081 RepID=A0A3Q7IEA2_SOLLC
PAHSNPPIRPGFPFYFAQEETQIRERMTTSIPVHPERQAIPIA